MCVLGTMCAAADPVDTLQAVRTASAFLHDRGLLRAAETPQVVERTAAAYVVGTPRGAFVLVAADTRLPSVLGYGQNACGVRPAALDDLLASYSRRLRTLRFGNLERKDFGDAVAPLLTTTRHQEAPYNALCPYYLYNDSTRSEERCVVGCVATALEQILTYYRRTYTLQDTLHGWTTPYYDVPDVLPGASVDTRLILDNYDGEEASEASLDAVARLSYWLGVAVHMSWAPGASGATSRRCVEPLKQAFGMGYVHYADSYRYAPSDWTRMLRAELQAQRPVYYAANTMRLNGHAFVVDGYNEEGLFHVNWGYGGHYDGYFDISILYSAEPVYDRTAYGAENGFISNHEAVFIHPDALTPELPDTLHRTGEELRVVDWRLLEAPMVVAYTPMTLTVQNTSDHVLTTPLELFTNLPTDTAFIAQGDYVALTSATLEPGETTTLTVHLRFDEGGERILRLSPDDVHVYDLGPVSVGGFAPPDLRYDNLAVSFPADSTAEFTLEVANGEDAARAGRILTYELGTPDDGGEYGVASHAHYFYLAAGETLRDTIRFRGLQPGTTYQLRVRCPWTIVRTLEFTLPAASGIGSPSMENGQWRMENGQWSMVNGQCSMVNGQCSMTYDLQGRRLASHPTRRGIYIENRKKILISH